MQDSRHASAMQEPSTSASLAIGVPEPAFTTVLASEGRSSPGTSSTRQHPSPSTRPSLTVPDSFREHRVGRHSPGPSPSPSVVRLSHVSSMFQRLSHFSTAGSGSRSCDGSVRKSSAISASLHSFFGAASRSSPIQRHSVLLTSWATDLPQAPRKTENESKKSKKHTLIFDDVVSATKYAKDDQLKDESRFLIMPGSRFLTIWRVVMVYVVLWAVVMAPFELAFSWWDPPEYMLVVSRLVDLFCIADMVMNFFIPIIKFGRMTTDKRSIAIQYLRTWFAIDFFTNIPWDLILSSAGKSRKVVKILKLPKVFRLTRLLRVAREEAHTLGTFFTVCGVLLLAHYFSCLWVALLIDCPDDDTSNAFRCPEIMAAYAQGLSVAMSTLMGSDGWLRFLIESGRTPEISSSGTGFVWMNAGIGVELVAALNCLVGACSLGVLFANIARAMDKQDSHTRLFNQRLRNVKQAIAQHGLPYEIYDRANKHFHYVWSCGTDSSRSLLNDEALSLDLRRELAYNLYGDLLRKVPFLAPAESQLLKQLCRHAVLEVFSPKSADLPAFCVVATLRTCVMISGRRNSLALMAMMEEGIKGEELVSATPYKCNDKLRSTIAFLTASILSEESNAKVAIRAPLAEKQQVASDDSIRRGTSLRTITISTPEDSDSAAKITPAKPQVVEFLDCAVHGVFCTYYKERDHLSIPALYCLDENARHLILLSGENLEETEVVCPLASIVSMFSLRKRGEASFPSAVMQSVQAKDRDGLLGILHKRRSDGKVARLCLSLGSAKACDDFLESMKGLVLSARAGKDTAN